MCLDCGVITLCNDLSHNPDSRAASHKYCWWTLFTVFMYLVVVSVAEACVQWGTVPIRVFSLNDMNILCIYHTWLIVGICHTGLGLRSSHCRCSCRLLVILFTVVSYTRSCGTHIRVRVLAEENLSLLQTVVWWVIKNKFKLTIIFMTKLGCMIKSKL